MTAPAAVHQGSCLCGGVRYETTAPLQGASHCHCSMCRKAHGAAFGSYGVEVLEHRAGAGLRAAGPGLYDALDVPLKPVV